MQTYLVGGAVRDTLLERPVVEKDWVIVGASPEQLLDQGFTPVGKDFPVFLHPTTKEEYALARTERKTAPGYSGFAFNAAADVTLEQDLLRRDLTINAIAQDPQGNLIDPYGGQADIHNRILRHVSPAFSEDPVRILRVARFAARYHHLGFTIAEETSALMQQMVDRGEVDALVAERVWKETQRALLEPNAKVFFTTLRQCGALARIMPELDALFGVPQKAEYHPEIDTGIHTMLTLDQIHRLNGSAAARFAALVHDLGKATTPPELLPAHHQHEERSVPLVKQLCQRLAVPKYERDLALAVARYHTHCHRALELNPSTIVKTIKAIDGFRQPRKFDDFLTCCEADARGRTGLEDRPYPNKAYLWGALQACLKIDISEAVAKGLSGKQIGEHVHKQRIHAIKQFRQQWQEATPYARK